ncbi:hypothetical protein NO371_17135 [Escherichia coli]|nr:hypothetical protein [Escherichia coli]
MRKQKKGVGSEKVKKRKERKKREEKKVGEKRKKRGVKQSSGTGKYVVREISREEGTTWNKSW